MFATSDSDSIRAPIWNRAGRRRRGYDRSDRHDPSLGAVRHSTRWLPGFLPADSIESPEFAQPRDQQSQSVVERHRVVSESPAGQICFRPRLAYILVAASAIAIKVGPNSAVNASGSER